ncbi:Vesicular-fusion protein sec18 [Smittium culicis]|uniref:Vesicular-fusion protein SEC18 n=1 Tax=Smittium culicis TaxID=133412 RepID=A0A1R1X3W8_9FUNG|nr:Vesicular-fusion protein sec18 [Smittium culicis]
MNFNSGYNRIVSTGEFGKNERSPHSQMNFDNLNMGPSMLRVTNCPNNEFAFKNLVAVSSRDFDSSTKYLIFEDFIFNIAPSNDLASGLIGPSRIHRTWARLSLNQEIYAQPFDPYKNGKDVYLSSMEIEVSFFNRAQEVKDIFDVIELSNVITKTFSEQIFMNEQIFVFDFRGLNIKGTVTNINVVSLDKVENNIENIKQKNFGILLPQTVISFIKGPQSNIQLKGNNRSRPANRIVQPDFKFEDMGIGGLDSEFSNIFRRAFASRIFPPDLIDKLGIQHVKGILLFGPPGTGKTLMARQIGKMLNSVEPIVVNGPEILNKYVGQSEENIRKLFGPAEQEYREKGDDSQLHIIIFDELDAICKQRGARSDSTGVGDSVVNQLLSKMDGVDQLNNILLIGMTNRKDLIDEALTRPGRLEVHIEVGLPDENGRLQILGIHTMKMRENNILHADVDLHELATLTRNFSGAEIAGLIKSASSFAFNRHIKVGTIAGVQADISKLEVTRDDFLGALTEVKPAFGASEEELSRCIRNHSIPFSPNVNKILEDGKLYIDQVRKSEQSPLISVLLHGESGSGKTALAATLAISSEFPFCKLISPDGMVGYSESSKINELNKVFTDSYKSPISVIMIDDIERLIEWVPIGPRFSNPILQTLIVLLGKQPPKGHRLLVLATTSQKHIMAELGLNDAFDADLRIPMIDELTSVDFVLNYFELFNSSVRADVISLLSESIESSNQAQMSKIEQGLYDNNVLRPSGLKIGIKKLLIIMETSRQDNDAKNRFISLISEYI